MWGWFGGQSAQRRRDAPRNAILGLREQLDMLQKRERHLESQMAEADATARKNISTNKTAAKSALRRKKVHEHTLEQTSAQIAQVEQQIYSIEAANINQETLNAMRNAGKAMKEIHGGMTIDQVDKTMDELREQQQLGEEIANAITSAPIGEPVDEGELEDELEGLEQEMLDERMVKTGAVPVGGELERAPVVPSLPVKASKVQEDDEEEELRKLQAEMAM
ncbi:ESCRT-III subunit protein snf7 [Knufia obscura]|uniref:Vacuolar-sorting protein SNF7 n=2 Tax=Knufia TaxID=430999 RepID=A0AAN8IC22_9EURO|nr:ESCRT-III subunit protein snf7 [Knufia obscura]KAK5958010.1 ESCRT-III subunit protein snf7 [Knufia fluminis]